MTDFAETLLAFSEKLAEISRAMLLEAAREAPCVDLKQDASFATATDRAPFAPLLHLEAGLYPLEDHFVINVFRSLSALPAT